MRAIMEIPEDELEELTLNDEERKLFQVDEQGGSKHLLNFNGSMVCALHSWGSQLHACPCKCRDQALSMHRFEEKGVHANILPAGPDGAVRHLHLAEVALLNGVDPYQEWSPIKFALCGLGQLASPIQSLWVGSRVKSVLDRFRGHTQVAPCRDLVAYLGRLISRAHMLWKPKPCGELQMSVNAWLPLRAFAMQRILELDFWDTAPGGTVSIA